jgi:hypothetical protein
MHTNIKRPWTLAALSLTALAATASAQTAFHYNRSDLLIGFRVTPGSGASSSYELVVDGGPITTYANVPTGNTITVANLTATELNNTFSDLNNLSWSAFADVSTNALSAGSTNYPLHTLWVSAPRSDLNTQTTPWNQDSYFGQGNVISRIDGLGGNASLYGSDILPVGIRNSPAAIILPAGDVTYSYSAYIGPASNFRGAFGGSPVEQVTSPTFTTDGVNVRSDLYLLLPDSTRGAGTYLGYFEFATNGVLTYTAGPSAVSVPQPTITSIVRNGNVSTVTFTTVSGGTYQLIGSGDITTPLANWSPIGSPAPGTGSPVSLTDNNSGATQYYAIIAH